MAVASDVSTLSGLLDKIEKRVAADTDKSKDARLSVKDILEVIGRRAYGPLLLIIGVLSISPLALLPGSTWLFAVLTLLIALQLGLDRKHLWLPRKALEMEFEETKVHGALEKIRPYTGWIDKVIRPRLEFLAGKPWIVLIALIAVAASLITFPLSLVPFAPFLPGVAIILIGLGVTAKDGVVLGLAMVFTIGAGWLVVRTLF